MTPGQKALIGKACAPKPRIPSFKGTNTVTKESVNAGGILKIAPNVKFTVRADLENTGFQSAYISPPPRTLVKVKVISLVLKGVGQRFEHKNPELGSLKSSTCFNAKPLSFEDLFTTNGYCGKQKIMATATISDGFGTNTAVKEFTVDIDCDCDIGPDGKCSNVCSDRRDNDRDGIIDDCCPVSLASIQCEGGQIKEDSGENGVSCQMCICKPGFEFQGGKCLPKVADISIPLKTISQDPPGKRLDSIVPPSQRDSTVAFALPKPKTNLLFDVSVVESSAADKKTIFEGFDIVISITNLKGDYLKVKYRSSLGGIGATYLAYLDNSARRSYELNVNGRFKKISDAAYENEIFFGSIADGFLLDLEALGKEGFEVKNSEKLEIKFQLVQNSNHLFEEFSSNNTVFKWDIPEFEIGRLALPDLVVREIEVKPANPVVNDNTIVKGIICNIGNNNAPESEVSLQYHYFVGGSGGGLGLIGTVITEKKRVPPIKAGACIDAEFNIKVSIAGTYSARIVADSAKEVEEHNETNNDAKKTFVAVTSGKPEIAVKSVSISPQVVRPGEDATLIVEWENIGTKDVEVGFKIKLYTQHEDDPEGEHALAEISVKCLRVKKAIRGQPTRIVCGGVFTTKTNLGGAIGSGSGIVTEIPGLPDEGIVRVTYTIQTDSHTGEGNWKIRAEADPNDRRAKVEGPAVAKKAFFNHVGDDPSNNSATASITVSSKPVLVIQNVKVPAEVKIRKQFGLTFEIANIGAVDSGPVAAGLYAGKCDVLGKQVDAWNIVSIASGQAIMEETIVGSGAELGIVYYCISANPVYEFSINVLPEEETCPAVPEACVDLCPSGNLSAACIGELPIPKGEKEKLNEKLPELQGKNNAPPQGSLSVSVPLQASIGETIIVRTHLRDSDVAVQNATVIIEEPSASPVEVLTFITNKNGEAAFKVRKSGIHNVFASKSGLNAEARFVGITILTSVSGILSNYVEIVFGAAAEQPSLVVLLIILALVAMLLAYDKSGLLFKEGLKTSTEKKKESVARSVIALVALLLPFAANNLAGINVGIVVGAAEIVLLLLFEFIKTKMPKGRPIRI